MGRVARSTGRTTVMVAAAAGAANMARDAGASHRRQDEEEEAVGGGATGPQDQHGGLYAEELHIKACAEEELQRRARLARTFAPDFSVMMMTSRRKLMEMMAFVVFLILFTCNALMQRPIEASYGKPLFIPSSCLTSAPPALCFLLLPFSIPLPNLPVASSFPLVHPP